MNGRRRRSSSERISSGAHACGVEPLLVKRDAIVRPSHAPAEPVELELAKLRAGHRFDVAIPDHQVSFRAERGIAVVPKRGPSTDGWRFLTARCAAPLGMTSHARRYNGSFSE